MTIRELRQFAKQNPLRFANQFMDGHLALYDPKTAVGLSLNL